MIKAGARSVSFFMQDVKGQNWSVSFTSWRIGMGADIERRCAHTNLMRHTHMRGEKANHFRIRIAIAKIQTCSMSCHIIMTHHRTGSLDELSQSLSIEGCYIYTETLVCV